MAARKSSKGRRKSGQISREALGEAVFKNLTGSLVRFNAPAKPRKPRTPVQAAMQKMKEGATQ